MIPDDILILYYYGDGLDRDERGRIEAALRDDPALALRYLELGGELEALRILPETAPPAAALHRWQTGLVRAARLEQADRSRPWHRHLRWAGAAAAFALLALALMPGWHAGPEPTPTPAVPATAATHTGASALQRGVQLHLLETGQLIEALASTEPGQRAAALTVAIERNRAYQRAAQDQDAERIARLLRAFEPSLLSLADRQTDLAHFDAERERLAFELDIARTGLGRPPARFL